MPLLPYPAAFPQEALLMMLDKFRGKEVGTPDLINAAWNVVGYGLSQSVGGGQMVAGDPLNFDGSEDSESAAGVIAATLRNNGVEVDDPSANSYTFIPWFTLIQISIYLIKKFALPK